MRFLTEGYEDSICPDGIASAGKASYVERNHAMVLASDFCVFYYNENYLPDMRKASKKVLTNYQPKSGTQLAFGTRKSYHQFIHKRGLNKYGHTVPKGKCDRILYF